VQIINKTIEQYIADPTPLGFTPSPTKRVHFAGGKVVEMNRKERRRNHLYGDRIRRLGG